MKIKAAVVRQAGGPFQMETLDLDDPREDEVLVRIVASGMCHSDLFVMTQSYPLPLPRVLGHEGAGFVESVGASISHVAPGDPVLLSFDSCGLCAMCADNHSAYCETFAQRNYSGGRLDGSETIKGVRGAFFYQSSFATHAIAHARNVVKIRADAPLPLLSMLGCGVQTGAGAVLNVLKPTAGSSFAVFGAGAVGLSALMAAKLCGCDPIIAVDRVPARLALARELGATDTFDAGEVDAVARLRELGGIRCVVEAAGVPAVVIDAIRSTRPLGTCATLGVYKPGTTVPIDFTDTRNGRKIVSITAGDADPQTFVPKLVDLFMEGRLPIDRMAKFYSFEDINQAAEDSESGATIKPILLIDA